MIEHIDSKTPNGGIRADIVYIDENNNETEKDTATQVRIIEYDKDDNVIFENWGNISNSDENEESPKQNMTLDSFSTTKDLDRQLETILKSIEPEVMKTLKKTKYFDKKE